MDEPTAWLRQARADWQAAEYFLADEEGTGRCHAIAKWQQTVEKAVKALVAALHDAGILSTNFRSRHEVARYIETLIRLPRASGNRTIQHLLYGLLDQNTRAGINTLDGLAPQLPPRRNTEYPFQDAQGQWIYPAAEGVFSEEEVQRFRGLAQSRPGRSPTSRLSHSTQALIDRSPGSLLGWNRPLELPVRDEIAA